MASVIRNMTGLDAESVTVGPYELGEMLGEGAMGVVYEAMDEDLGRSVAVKVLRRRETSRGAADREQSIREAKTMAEVVHRNVVHVHKVGFDQGQAWISMDLVRGSTLRRWLHDEERSWRTVLEVYVQVGRGLAVAHARNVVHGDFKPDNVLIGDDDVPKVTDFGLALLDGEPGTAGGTPEYMAPEQYLGRHRDARSDQFSFCVALFEGLTGHHPYSRWSFDEFASTLQERDPNVTRDSIRREYRRSLFINTSNGKLRWPRLPLAVPRRVRDALARGLHPDPDRRFTTMSELVEQLDLVEAHRKARRRNTWTVGVATASAIALAFGIAVGMQHGRNERALVCQAAPDHYAEVWNDGVRASIARGISESTTGQIGDIVELHRARWLTAHDQACEATVMKGEMDAWKPVASCLEQRLELLGQGLAGLAGLDDSQAVAMIDELASAAPGACLLDGTAIAVQKNVAAEHRDAIAQVREELAKARIDEIARRYEAGLATVDQQIERAKEIGYEPLLAEAFYQRGRLQMYRAKYETNELDGRNTPGIDDLEVASTYAATSFHRSTTWDITIFRAKALALLKVPPPPIDFGTQLLAQGSQALLREQRAELLEMQGFEHRRRAKLEKDPDAAIVELELSIDAYQAALKEQTRRGYGVGAAKVRANMARAYIELGTRRGVDAGAGDYRRATGLIEDALGFWGETKSRRGYGQHYVAPLYGTLVNAKMRIASEREAARMIVDSQIEQLQGQGSQIYVLLPGILAYTRERRALELADQAVALIEQWPPPSSLETQLRMYALDALVRDPQVTQRIDDVRSWRRALAERPPLTGDLATRQPLVWAYLGRASLVLGELDQARQWLESARDSTDWSTRTPTTRAELLLDLTEVYIGLSDLGPARRALAGIQAVLDQIPGTAEYRTEVLVPRYDDLRRQLDAA
ncbi:MAG: serine/threonine-protein kinase [Nannocystaceae bacterium]